MVLKYSGLIVRYLLAALFLLSSILKLTDLDTFAQSMHAYQILPKDFVPFFSVYVPVLELGLAIGFAIGRFSFAAGVLSFVVIFIFQLALYSLIARGIEVDCACFGRFTASPKSALIRNFVILGSLFLLLYSLCKSDKLQNCN